MSAQNSGTQGGTGMPGGLPCLCFSQIVQSGPVLLIDTASSCVQVGLLRDKQPALWETSTAEAGVALFACVEKLLSRAALALDAINVFIFCDGPGSVLGIRTAAVAIRTWNALRARPAYAYCSLTLVAHWLAKRENARDLALIADARRDTWHHVAIEHDGNVSALKRVPSGALNGALAMPEHFRNWTPLPAGVRAVPYDLEKMLPVIAEKNIPLFLPAPEPDAFLHEEPVYQTWTPQVHQAL